MYNVVADVHMVTSEADPVNRTPKVETPGEGAKHTPKIVTVDAPVVGKLDGEKEEGAASTSEEKVFVFVPPDFATVTWMELLDVEESAAEERVRIVDAEIHMVAAAVVLPILPVNDRDVPAHDESPPPISVTVEDPVHGMLDTICSEIAGEL